MLLKKLLMVSILFATMWAYLAIPGIALTSSHYQIQEDFVGGGGGTNAASSGFQASDSLGGGAGVGDAAATSQKIQTGATTTNDPSLSFVVNTPTVALGTLTTGATQTSTATFSVLNYTSYGYSVSVIGSPPSNGAHTLSAPSSPVASATGTEQFGINLAANTLPTNFGAAPSQVPNTTFSFGAAASGYNTANVYKYVSGNTIALAAKSSGQTTYTISYIANISIGTQGGSYSGNQTLVVVGTY